MVVLVPVPEFVVPPGDLVTVHVPEEGRLLSTTLPMATAHVGCVIVPTVGVDGVGGCVFIATPFDDPEVHPSAFVTVKVYVLPAGNPDIVVDVPDPVLVVPPGDLVMVHVPEEGSPLIKTLPVGTEQVGWVIAPMLGAEGVTGWVLITTLFDAEDVHPTELVTVKVYVVPAVNPDIVMLVPDPV